jgi:hypothetical protein
VQVWTDIELVFVVVRMLGLVQVVVVLVVSMRSLQVVEGPIRQPERGGVNESR